MTREFEEEAGRTTQESSWQYFLRMRGVDPGGELFVVDFFASRERSESLHFYHSPEEEKLEVVRVAELHAHHPTAIDNLPWVVALAVDCLRDGRPGFVEASYGDDAPLGRSEMLRAMRAVEGAHFRSRIDTGAADQAMVVWNSLRHQLSLPLLSLSDLPKWDGERYATPDNSTLLSNLPSHIPPCVTFGTPYRLAADDTPVADMWLCDYADGVPGRYCVGRQMEKYTAPTWEYWTGADWASAGRVYTRDQAVATRAALAGLT